MARLSLTRPCSMSHSEEALALLLRKNEKNERRSEAIGKSDARQTKPLTLTKLIEVK